MAHTPGPWGFFPDFDPDFEDPKYVVDLSEERLPYSRSQSPYSYVEIAVIDGQPEAEANARLMSAAPDLLASLEEAKTFVLVYCAQHASEFASEPVTGPEGFHPTHKAIWDRIEAALAKAREDSVEEERSRA